ncbi:MAG TPA: SpvB/TcaC N-terminal domain-containing protein [Pyrinomonadaceae bacterium]|nr:SpvB/TcaC N-terminal domain-containing protein [Pyrinomonadaceae bacterium]
MGKNSEAESSGQARSLPAISMPKGGGAIRGLGEKFAANPVNGTGSVSIPIYTSPGRAGFAPQLSLSYNSGAGNSEFGFGWNLSLASITRKTDKGLPRYEAASESDLFILSGAEDLVPMLEEEPGKWSPRETTRVIDNKTYRVQQYRPRIEGLFARIERWTNETEPSDNFWRSISRENITTWYGRTDNSRIADPTDPTRVFSWLICESHDDKGNAIVYEYKAEDSDGVLSSQAHERNRTNTSRSANRYLKFINYGNRSPYYPVLNAEQPLPQPAGEWLFKVVFDYGEHSADAPAPDDLGQWPARQDPFSSYRAGFEVRTYRLCQRVLMFHNFTELGTTPYLVRSTDFNYSYENDPTDSRNPVFSFMLSTTQSGFKRQADGSYLKRSLPPLEFEYSEPIINEEVRQLDSESLENLPYGLDGSRYQLLDLDGEGIAGIFTEQGGGWFYKRNLSPLNELADYAAVLGPIEQAPQKPSLSSIVSGRSQFIDLAGDGQLDVAELQASTPGFYERTHDETWGSFVSFQSLPNIDWGSPNLKFIDLTGDGHADVLISEDEAFCWFPSLSELGFGEPARLCKVLDEEQGPNLVFSDGTQSIYLADMSGDGLSDIARIRNGEICFWPNMGYGRFGAKVTMDNAPWFDAPDHFDQKRIRLADIDGSGVTDIIYLTDDGVVAYFNLSGNGWSQPQRLAAFPVIDDLSSVQVADLLGNGTACLVWSSPLPGDTQRPLRYVDLMGGQKPHLLVKSANNLGVETYLHYSPSTRFYLADQLAGKPWVTKIPFPVHVIERVETYDRISGNRFVTRYAYHHGYFDGVEREFRGFGMVEQWDTEEFAALNGGGVFPAGTNIEQSSHIPPVLTRTWFHTGAYLDRNRISNFFAGVIDESDIGEYYREPGLTDEEARQLLLDDTVLPAGLTIDEEREACRALKGAMLRQEVYALDGTEKENHPYTVTEQNFTIRLLQPMADNPHAVFFTHAREAISYHYEREPADPRITQSLTLEVDGFGDVLRTAAIGYGRRQADSTLSPEDQARQNQIQITYTENGFTNPVELDDVYRTPLPSESRKYEMTGMPLSTSSARFSFDEVFSAGSTAAPLNYEQIPDAGGVLEKRLIEHLRSLYRGDDLAGPLPLGQLDALGLPFESYRLALTPGLITQIYADRVTEHMLANDCRYVHSEGDGAWWIPSGQTFFSMDPTITPAQELVEARQHFLLPRRLHDAFGQDSTITYDYYDLLMAETIDALGNRVQALNDYRVLQPSVVTDPNGNRSEVAFDAMGLVVGTSVMGKSSETKGDSLAGFVTDLDDATIAAHLQDPFDNPHAILQQATSRLVYDIYAFQRTQSAPQPQPATVYALVRETHEADLRAGEQTRIQHSFSYSDGFGREIQKKLQAKPGPLSPGAMTSDPRWVGSGWTILNNKGKPVRQYEPFFSSTHGFEFDRTVGVSPVLFYDPVGRVVGKLHPNHTWDKVVFDPWRQEAWDVNDTLSFNDPKDDPDVADFFSRLADEEYLPGWHAVRADGSMGAEEQTAAIKAAVHAATPGIAHMDSLGRTFLTLVHNKFKHSDAPLNDPPTEAFYSTRVIYDMKGNQRAVIDALDRIVVRYDYNMLDARIHSASMEAGERWMLNDVAGNSVYAWNSRDHRLRTTYDALRRPSEVYLQTANEPELLVGKTTYGEGQPNPEASNLRGKPYQSFDGAGVVTTGDYDFKGNPLSSSRQLAIDYKNTLDWSRPVALEMELFFTSTVLDALNRPVTLTTPDNTILHPTYDETNLLARLEANLQGAAAATVFVSDLNYNAKGQRDRIEYGNGVSTTYEYDPLTFRLVHLQTVKGAAALQDLIYIYDPAGNITQIRDDAQQTTYFRNQQVQPNNDYNYDAIYQLIEATGREHLGQLGNPPTAPDAFDEFRTGLNHPGDGNAMGTYRERYVYDSVGNFLEMRHVGSGPSHPGWTRGYTYNETSLIEPARCSNRLSSTRVGSGAVEPYTYDTHGSMISMPHLSMMSWDYFDRLSATARQVVNGGSPETTYYVYDAVGKRVRKVNERQAGLGETPTITKERIYLGGSEVYREYSAAGSAVSLERKTLHVMDGQQRVALVETLTQGADGSPSQLVRYQLGNHLGSSSLELNETGAIISYEEYYPYGSTSYQAVVASIRTAAKRYRYTGKERDEETGLHYHGARYYASWLGRWSTTDPAGLVDGSNLYRFNRGNPLRFTDPTGNGAVEQVNNVAYGVGGAIENKASSVWQGVSSLASAIYNDPGGTALTMAAESLPGKVLTGNFSGAWDDVVEEGAYALGNVGNIIIYPYLGQQYVKTLMTGDEAEIQAATEEFIDTTAGVIDTGSDLISFGTKAAVKVAAKKSLLNAASGAAMAAVIPGSKKPPIEVLPGPNQVMIRPIGKVDGRATVLVQKGTELALSNKRTGEGGIVPYGAQIGDWEFSEGWLERDMPVLGLTDGWFNKSRFSRVEGRTTNAFGEFIPEELDRWGTVDNYNLHKVLQGHEDAFLGRLQPLTWREARERVTGFGYDQPFHTQSELYEALPDDW